MSKNKKGIINDIPNDEIELFGQHKTREQIKAEEKARKAKERAAMKEVAATRRRAAKEGAPGSREMIPVFIVVAVIVVLCVVLLVIQFSRAEEQNAWQRNESFESYFADVEVAPEMSDEGIKASIVEAYYTNNGHLMVRMILSNGTEADLRLESIEVSLSNGEGAFIGGGYAKVENQEIIVPTEGTANYTFYISPEHLSITDDPLTTLSYDVEAVGSVVTEDDTTTE